MNATCKYCSLPMDVGTSCTETTYGGDDFPDGVERERVRYGDESSDRDTDFCHDCNAPRGGLHHPGCDVEECPFCSGQAISCECGEEETEA